MVEAKVSKSDLNRASPVPLWFQILSDLRTRLALGEFEKKFPSDLELKTHYQVSRQTVREALRGLQSQGIITRERGRGSRIAAKEFEQSLGHLYSFARTAQSLGLDEYSRVVGFDEVRAGISAKHLSLDQADSVLRIKRIRILESEPIAYETIWIPNSLSIQMTKEDFQSGSIYDLFIKKCSLIVDQGEELIRPKLPSKEICRALNIAREIAILEVERTARSGETPVEFRRSILRGDKYVLSAKW